MRTLYPVKNMAEWNSQANDVFLRAAEVESPVERRLFLDQRCGDDTALRAQVESLLAASAKVGSFLNQPAAQALAASQATADHELIAERAGTVIGPYKLLEQIGEGGMGLVFVAEQQQPVRRKVALKIIKPGMDSRQVIARFEAERQALALMDHPNIARVLDAGATSDGRPFFVMDLVKGTPITEFCDIRRLSARQRLELFVPVCQAIQHAHQKGVIHRDIKPSNVLVELYDDHPVPKVIDFGVAKAIGQQLTDKTLYTGFGTLLGTPAYMAPEQATFNALDVDTRADVYALGILLYELLAGSTPFEPDRLQKAALEEVLRVVREEEPLRPSARLSTSKSKASIAEVRQTDPEKLARLMRGELDWIVMRCLEKERIRRYETAAGLAKDVQRYLADEPVEARPASIGYRLSKTYRRNRAALTVAAMFAALLITSLAVVTWMWRAERDARADTELARRDAEAKTREVLEGSERMNSANALIDLARQQAIVGHWAGAEASHNRAIKLRPDANQVWLKRGELYAQMGLWDLAFADFKHSFDLREPDTVVPWFNFAVLHLMRGDEPGFRRVCKRTLEQFGGSDELFIRGHGIRAYYLIPDAIPGIDQQNLKYDSVAITPRGVLWVGYFDRGIAHFRAGRFPEAVRDFRESLARTNYIARGINYPVLAMALHQTGDPGAPKAWDDARKEYDRWMKSVVDSRNQYLPWPYWYDWPEFLIFYREAYRLIEGTDPPDDPRQHALRDRALATLGRK